MEFLPHGEFQRRSQVAAFFLLGSVVAQLYQCRWNIEIFFKWIKQHLRIKSFYGNSPNAVKTQIWVAISVYLLVAIARKRLGVKASLYTFLQVAGMTIFEKRPMSDVFHDLAFSSADDPSSNQLNLFEI